MRDDGINTRRQFGAVLRGRGSTSHLLNVTASHASDVIEQNGLARVVCFFIRPGRPITVK
jgi:hypothetical protein